MWTCDKDKYGHSELRKLSGYSCDDAIEIYNAGGSHALSEKMGLSRTK